MAIFSLGLRQASVVTTAPFGVWELITAPLQRTALLEFSFSTNVAAGVTAQELNLGRSSVLGVNPLPLYALLPEDPGTTPSMCNIAINWSAPPIASANMVRRVVAGVSVIANMYWSFPRGFVVPASSSIGLWSLLSNTRTMQLDISATVNE